MNMVAMARHGLILNDNEATGSGKVSKYLPGLRASSVTANCGDQAQITVRNIVPKRDQAQIPVFALRHMSHFS